jgi:hypothetical protein
MYVGEGVSELKLHFGSGWRQHKTNVMHLNNSVAFIMPLSFLLAVAWVVSGQMPVPRPLFTDQPIYSPRQSLALVRAERLG